MSLSGHIGRALAEFSLKSLPDEVIEKARTCLLNGYGIGLACHNTVSVRVARSVALSLDVKVSTERRSWLMGSKFRSQVQPWRTLRSFMAADKKIPAAQRIWVQYSFLCSRRSLRPDNYLWSVSFQRW